MSLDPLLDLEVFLAHHLDYKGGGGCGEPTGAKAWI